jgi:hypothetical protein
VKAPFPVALDHERIPLVGVPAQYEAQIRRLVQLNSIDSTTYITEKAKLNEEVLGYLDIGMREKGERMRERAMYSQHIYRD